MPNFHCYSDGFCEGNGSNNAKAGGSYAIYETTTLDLPQSNLIHEALQVSTPLEHIDRFTLNTFGSKATNNVAEASALLQLVTTLVSKGYLVPDSKVVIFMDSQLIMYQVQGVYKCKDHQIKKVLVNLYTVFTKWEKKYDLKIQDHLELRWIPGVVMKKSIIGH